MAYVEISTSIKFRLLIAYSFLINAVRSTYNYSIYTTNGCYGGMMTIDCGGRLKISIIEETYGRHPEEKCFPSPGGSDCSVDGDFYRNLCNYQSKCQHFGVGWKYINRTGCRDLYTNYVHLVYACYSELLPRVPLNQPCYDGDICGGGQYSSCLQGFCRCRNDYFESNSVCVPYGRKRLNEACGVQDSCIDEHSECYQNVCDCQANYVNQNGRCVLETLSDFCSTNNDCPAQNTACISGVCACRVGYVQINGACEVSTQNTSTRPPTSTTPVMLEDFTPAPSPSPWSNQCPSAIGLCRDPNSQCVNGTCLCHSSFYFANDSCKSCGALNAPCLFGLCMDANGYCNGQGICVCREAYYEKNAVCVHKLYLGQNCDSFDVCSDVNSQCQAQKCTCMTGYQELNGRCDQSGRLGSRCQSSPPNSCSDADAVCQNGVCDCRPGFFRSMTTIESSRCKMKIVLGGVCVLDDVCADERALCLDGQCVCRSTHYADNGRCVPKGVLNAPCIQAPSFGDGCLETGLYCSAGFCRCRSEYYVFNGTCGPRSPLGQQCEASDQCIDEASLCSNNRCSCITGFRNIAGVCVQNNVTVGSVFGPCSNSTSCSDVNSQCSRGICRCKPTFFYKSTACVQKLSIDVSCSSGDVCIDPNSACVAGRCQCLEEFVLDSATKSCRAKGVVGRPCLRGNVCVTQHSICSLNECACGENFFAKSDLCIRKIYLWGSCISGDECQDRNSICFEGQCQCKENFYHKTGTCVPKVSVGDTCSSGDRCLGLNADCTNGRCVCRQNFTAQNNNVCKSSDVRGRLFTECSTDGDCSVANSVCLNSICVCSVLHFAAFGQCIPKIRLSERCDVNRDVCNDVNSVCKNGVCSCQADYYETQQKCVSLGIFGAPCIFGSQCMTANSQCTNGYCVCMTGHFFRNGICVPKIRVEEKCEQGDGCLDANAECTSIGLCQCVSGYAVYYGRCVLLVALGQPCGVDSICSDLNSLCVNGFCQCVQGFQKTSNNICQVQSSSGAIPGSLGGVCLTGNVCSSSQLICTVTGLCACAPEFYNDQQQCVRKVNLGGSCADNIQCLDVNALCSQGQCHCARYYTNYNNICVLSSNSTLMTCGRDADCSYEHASCVQGYCSCSSGFRLLAGQCYYNWQIIPDISCNSDSLCVSPSKCLGSNCVCPSGFFFKANSCRPTVVLGGMCSLGDICGDQNAVCSTSTGTGSGTGEGSASTSGTCICNVNYIVVSGFCVLQSSVNASLIPCISASSNCFYPRAACVNGFCGCEAGFRYVAGKCYRVVGLGSSCGAGDVCSDENAICDQTGICSCQSNYRREADSCILDSEAAAAFFGLDPALGIFLLILAILAALLLLLLLLCCLVYCCRRCRKARKDNYERKLIESESVNNSELNTLNKRHEGQVNTSYLATSSDNNARTTTATTTRTTNHHLNQQQRGETRGFHSYADAQNEGVRMEAEEEASASAAAAAAASYGVEDLPARVTRLNREEIRGGSTVEELDLVDMDAAEGGGSLQYRFVGGGGGGGGGGLSSAYARHDNGRHVTSGASSSSRRQMTSSQFSETDDRRHVTSSSSVAGGSVSTPSTIHRNVSAFGEITVMPVGDEDEHLRISVGEEII